MNVLLSIKPEFAYKIFDGSKKYEYRRTIFVKSGVKRVIVYVSHPIRSVIGEFKIAEILYDDIYSLWTRTKQHAGISENKFLDYFKNKPRGYAIRVKSTRMYRNPLPLTSLMVSSAPQSFMYL